MSKTCEKIGSFATMLLLGILTYMVSEVYSFSDGTALTAGANRNMFCNRLPRDRMPVHMTCQGPCPPQAGPAPFRLEVYASTYWDEPIRVEVIGVAPVNGFVISALNNESSVVGSFEDSPDGSYTTATCSFQSRIEGFMAFHTRATTQRSGVRLLWNGNERHYGDIQFIAWVVLDQSTFWRLESHWLTSEKSAGENIDIHDRFYDLVKQTFGVLPVFDEGGLQVSFVSQGTELEGNETLAANQTLLAANGTFNGTFITEDGELVPTLEAFEAGFMKRLEGGYNLDSPFAEFDRDTFTASDFDVQELDESHFDAFNGAPLPSDSVSVAQTNPFDMFNGGNNPFGNPFANPFASPFGPFGPNGNNPFGNNPFGQNMFGQNNGQFGPGQQFSQQGNNNGPGQNGQFGPFGQGGQGMPGFGGQGTPGGFGGQGMPGFGGQGGQGMPGGFGGQGGQGMPGGFRGQGGQGMPGGFGGQGMPGGFGGPGGQGMPGGFGGQGGQGMPGGFGGPGGPGGFGGQGGPGGFGGQGGPGGFGGQGGPGGPPGFGGQAGQMFGGGAQGGMPGGMRGAGGMGGMFGGMGGQGGMGGAFGGMGGAGQAGMGGGMPGGLGGLGGGMGGAGQAGMGGGMPGGLGGLGGGMGGAGGLGGLGGGMGGAGGLGRGTAGGSGTRGSIFSLLGKK